MPRRMIYPMSDSPMGRLVLSQSGPINGQSGSSGSCRVEIISVNYVRYGRLVYPAPRIVVFKEGYCTRGLQFAK